MSAERDMSAVDAAVRELRLELDEADDGQARHPYRMTGSGIWWLKADRDGGDPVPVRLTNFQVRIVRDIVEDDGLETRHLFEVEGHLPGRGPTRQSVLAGQFASLGWVLDLLGAEAILETGNAISSCASKAWRSTRRSWPTCRRRCSSTSTRTGGSTSTSTPAWAARG